MADQLERQGSYGDVQPAKAVPAIPLPGPVQRCIERGRKHMLRNAHRRRYCERIEEGETFHYLDASGLLQSKAVVTNPRGGGKPPHRSRRKFNFIRPIVDEKVSAATQRIPGYEVDPATTDPEDAGGAKLSEKVAIYGYDQWRLRKATLKAVKTAIGKGGSAFALPYFEPNVGPYVMTPDGPVGTGELRVKVFNGNEVFWEPGCSFEESPWWGTEQAMPCSLVKELPGFAGGPLAPDANSSDVPSRKPEGDLMIVRNYYERPCPKWPNGRWFTSDGHGRVIVDNRLLDPTAEYVHQDYPLQDADGTVLDEPLLHALFWDPADEDDLGLTWQLIDFQLAAQDCLNKMLEYKNLGLNLQIMAPVNSLIDRPDDVPGAVKYYKPDPVTGNKPEWAPAPSGQILNALLQIFNLISGQMMMVGSFQDIQADANVAARTGQLAIEQSHARWQTFLGDLAEWHSRLMRHCLLLTARYYTEPRLLAIRGRMGWESIKDFRGSHLLGQTNVRVFPGSLEYLSRAQITARAQYYASMGWISGTQAMEAIESGDLGPITEAYEDDKARINRIIQRIRDGSIMQMPTRTQEVPAIDPATGAPAVNPMTGQPLTMEQPVPAWMPDEYDTLPVWEEQLSLWLKSDDYERSPQEAQEIGKMMWQGLQQLKQKKAADDAQQQQQMAQALGMGNAAAPQGPPALPSLPNVANPDTGSAGPSGGQPAPPSPSPQG